MKLASSMSLTEKQMEQLKNARPDLEIETLKVFAEPDSQVEALLCSYDELEELPGKKRND